MHHFSGNSQFILEQHHPFWLSYRCNLTGDPLRLQDCSKDPQMVTVAGNVFKLPSFVTCDELGFMKEEKSTGFSTIVIHIWATIPANHVSDAYTSGDPCILISKERVHNQGQSCAFQSLCALLNKTETFLVGESTHSLDTHANAPSFSQLYILRPDEVITSLFINHLSDI